MAAGEFKRKINEVIETQHEIKQGIARLEKKAETDELRFRLMENTQIRQDTILDIQGKDINVMGATLRQLHTRQQVQEALSNRKTDDWIPKAAKLLVLISDNRGKIISAAAGTILAIASMLWKLIKE